MVKQYDICNALCNGTHSSVVIKTLVT